MKVEKELLGERSAEEVLQREEEALIKFCVKTLMMTPSTEGRRDYKNSESGFRITNFFKAFSAGVVVVVDG